MENFKIVLFLCNWGPHAAFQTLQDTGRDIPPEINMIRIPCTGRITKALLFKAFEMGADGVALVGCSPGTCRYGSGTESARKNTEATRDIIDLLGLGRERMRLETFLPDDWENLHAFITDFTRTIQQMGKSPIQSIPEPSPAGEFETTIKDIIKKHDAFACQDCGKCTSSCPLALTGKAFSPRALVAALIDNDLDGDQTRDNIWSCLTCGTCYSRCPSEVNFPELIQDMRCHIIKGKQEKTRLTHGGFFQSLMRSMTCPGVSQKRWQTLPETIQTDPGNGVVFHGGCAPYYDIFFRNHHGVATSNVIDSALKLLNFFDIRPALLGNERCCGHDLLWSGDRENFLRLAALNARTLNDRGTKELITACPECYRTFAVDYPKHGIKLNFKVTHLYEILEAEIDRGAVTFNGPQGIYTFQDSCRLNGLPELKALPRKLIKRFTRGSFVEMTNSGDSAICCGNCAWTGCDAFSKALQVKRIKQARQTGSDTMITACSKCRIHLGCAMEDPFVGGELKMDLQDLTTIIANHICWE
ncbi:MAG: hydrogenase iron-sulfur subunit [Pseudomonadota bacterium]